MKTEIDKIALILAAGKGKRMKSDLPKVLHRAQGKYVIDYVIEAARQAGLEHQILVIGHQADKVEIALRDRGVKFVRQEEQLGTGHAVMMAAPLLEDFQGDLVVLCGDMPLVKAQTIRRLVEERQRLNAAAVVLSVVLEYPGSYGRIVRDDKGFLKAIIEHRDADNNIKRINEVNTGTYCFDWRELRPILSHLNDDNEQKEYYLTDSISVLVKAGKRVGAIVAGDPLEGLGINSLAELKAVEEVIKRGTRAGA